ncbi:uncharacterized protein At3g43530-like [Eutrema salsugineum]|uniref:uncharacterized protein At3g43530-like n=1 Tax=Eutrema salsugineum TaxID=72664 RepID=UPI000CED5359|nr:uncharacterized protein At3g43530-like [Eutrema salsugineum]
MARTKTTSAKPPTSAKPKGGPPTLSELRKMVRSRQEKVKAGNNDDDTNVEVNAEEKEKKEIPKYQEEEEEKDQEKDEVKDQEEENPKDQEEEEEKEQEDEEDEVLEEEEKSDHEEEIEKDQEEEKGEELEEEENEEQKEEGEDDDEQEAEDDDEQEAEEDVDYRSQAIPPEKLCFEPGMFNINIKLSGRCYIEKVVKTLEKVLDERELKWFKTHPQFKHFFHMYLEENHKSQGMWMLILCMVPSSKMKECWFVVNGVPIWYSLRELGLISGLNCRSYPKNYERLGGDSSKFVAKYFGEGKKKVTLKNVDEKMESMKSSKVRGRMNIANMKDIRNIVKNLNRNVPEGANKVFPSFIIPMEDIHSVLAASKQLRALIMDDEDIDQDVADYVVDGWKSILLEEKSEIFFEEMFKKDVNSRKNKGKKASGPKTPARKTASTPTTTIEVEKLIAGLKGLTKTVEDGFMEMRKKLDDHEKRIKKMKLYVGEEKKRIQEDEDNRLNFDADYHGGGEEANDGAGCAGKKQTEGENVEENVEKNKEENEEGADGEKDKEENKEGADGEKDKKENEEIDGEVPTRVTRTSVRTKKKSQYKQTPFTEDKKGKKRSTNDEKKKGAPKGKKQKT